MKVMRNMSTNRVRKRTLKNTFSTTENLYNTVTHNDDYVLKNILNSKEKHNPNSGSQDDSCYRPSAELDEDLANIEPPKSYRFFRKPLDESKGTFREPKRKPKSSKSLSGAIKISGKSQKRTFYACYSKMKINLD